MMWDQPVHETTDITSRKETHPLVLSVLTCLIFSAVSTLGSQLACGVYYLENMSRPVPGRNLNIEH